ncbi:hypothetical protein H7849_13885 [Alloacidobacterium dinghuense]|uniref:Salivary lipocalin n=1 Tax=Alloacidobacterium dinghuense TaxID=2763107 RepID=A0A7G8BRP4_9BACT|nr:hypothetical protein [Alloacidobacterium dinghuense]QNI35214.1 hypothetical protein H7849_13885 [Alloacidobacterium dinghuense]
MRTLFLLALMICSMVTHGDYCQETPPSENAEKAPTKSATSTDKNFASRFPLYVQKLRIVTQYHWNLNDVDASTPPGAECMSHLKYPRMETLLTFL